MDYVNLGATGLRVSRVCLGMMSYGEHESREWTLEDALAAEQLALSPEEIERLEELYIPHAVAGHA